MTRKLVNLLLLALIISGCGPLSTPGQEPPSTEETPQPKPTAFSPVTLTPSLTPLPTWTNTSTVTPTLTPSKTPIPTRTKPLPTPTVTTIPPLSRSLKEFANQNGKHIGSLIRWDYLLKDPNYEVRLLEQFDMVTINGFGYTYRAPGTFDFSSTDPAVAYAVANKLRIRAQPLIYHGTTPNWLKEGNWTAAEARAMLKEYVQGVVSHYHGKVDIWIVANEIMGDDGKFRPNVWYDAIGPEYVNLAYRWARQADPNAVLMYNDYHLERPGQKANAVFRMLRQMIQDEVPIGGVGFQLHLELGSTPDLETLQSQMQRFARLGLIVDVTELDVRLKKPFTQDRLGAQADSYETVMQACLNIPRCQNFTMWGFTDAYSWVDRYFPGYGGALAFDENYNPKPAFDSLIRVMRIQKP